MTWILRHVLFLAVLPYGFVLSLSAQRAKIIVDQDARGPATTDMDSILMFAQSPKVDVLGITIVTGDQWVKEETEHTLRALEIVGRTDIPVVPGAEGPLINSKEAAELWEQQFGSLNYKGAWSARNYHPPDVVPALPEGAPTTKPLNENAVDFIIRMVHTYPNQVTLWAGGPLTNIALAVREDPQVAILSKELVLMGGGFNVSEAGIQRMNGRREFNWWFDPEAVRIVMSASWKKIVITPNDVAIKTNLSKEVQARIAKVDTPLTRYLGKYSHAGVMWDEIAAAAFLDPEIISDQRQLYVNVDINHGASYGQTIFVDSGTNVPSWWKLANVQFDLNAAKFYDIYVNLMTAPMGSGKAATR